MIRLSTHRCSYRASVTIRNAISQWESTASAILPFETFRHRLPELCLALLLGFREPDDTNHLVSIDSLQNPYGINSSFRPVRPDSLP